MTNFAYSPWFKYTAIGVLAGASGYVLAKPSRYALAIAGAAAVAVPLGVAYAKRFFQKWTLVSGPPTVAENLLLLTDPPQTGVKIPEALDPVKTKFFQNEKTGRYYAQVEKSQGSFTTSEWWVLA
jgi:hypothetical protein